MRSRDAFGNCFFFLVFYLNSIELMFIRKQLFLRKKLSFWLSACSILIVVPLLKLRPSFPLICWTEGNCIDS